MCPRRISGGRCTAGARSPVRSMRTRPERRWSDRGQAPFPRTGKKICRQPERSGGAAPLCREREAAGLAGGPVRAAEDFELLFRRRYVIMTPKAARGLLSEGNEVRAWTAAVVEETAWCSRGVGMPSAAGRRHSDHLWLPPSLERHCPFGELHRIAKGGLRQACKGQWVFYALFCPPLRPAFPTDYKMCKGGRGQ